MMNGTMLNGWWMVRRDAKVDIAVAQGVLAKYGLDTSLMNEVTERQSVRRGIDEMHNRRGTKRTVAEKIRETGDVAVFGILNLERYVGVCKDTAAYKQNTKVVLDKATGTVTATGLQADEVYERINANKGFYNDADLRRLCYNLVRSIGGVSKRPTGGVYLMPAMFGDKVDALRNALKEMVGDLAAVYVERIYDGAEERANAATSIADDLMVRATRISDAVKNITKQTCRLQNHKQNVIQLQEMTAMYQGILGEQAALENLTLVLNAASEKIEKAIVETSIAANK